MTSSYLEPRTRIFLSFYWLNNDSGGQISTSDLQELEGEFGYSCSVRQTCESRNRMPSFGRWGWRAFVKSASSLGGTHQREEAWLTAGRRSGYRRLYLKDKCMHAESFLWPPSCRETGVIEKDGFCQSGDTESSTCVCSFGETRWIFFQSLLRWCAELQPFL